MSKNKNQQSGKAPSHGKNKQKSDSPKTTTQTVSPSNRLKLYITMSENQQSGKAPSHRKNEQESDNPKTTTQTVSPTNRLKLYITIALVLLLALVAYIIRYKQICVFTCAPRFSPKQHGPTRMVTTRMVMSSICGTPVASYNPGDNCFPVPMVQTITLFTS